MERKRNILLSIAEILLLLILPLPFLKLNMVYVITASVIIILSKVLRREQWSDYGFKKVSAKPLLLSLFIGAGYGLLDNYVTEPLINKLVGSKPDLSAFDWVVGNTEGLIIMLALGWFIGGLFEETFFRGYLFHRIGTLVKNRILYVAIVLVVISIVFAFAHSYQGISGIAGTFIFSVVLGLLYLYFRNVWYLILIHGLYDTVGIFKLFMGN